MNKSTEFFLTRSPIFAWTGFDASAAKNRCVIDDVLPARAGAGPPRGPPTKAFILVEEELFLDVVVDKENLEAVLLLLHAPALAKFPTSIL